MIVLYITSVYSVSIPTVQETASIAGTVLIEHRLVPTSQIVDAAAGSHDPLWT